MKIKLIFILMIGMAGMAKADFLRIQEDSCWNTDSQKLGECPQFINGWIITHPKESAGRTKSEQKRIGAELDHRYSAAKIMFTDEFICPNGWKKSNYFLVTTAEAPPGTPLGYVEICKDNGLIRVKR